MSKIVDFEMTIHLLRTDVRHLLEMLQENPLLALDFDNDTIAEMTALAAQVESSYALAKKQSLAHAPIAGRA